MGVQGVDYDIVCGVSVGALNTVGLAMTPRGRPVDAIDWLERFWREKVHTGAIYRRWWPFGRLHSLWKKSVYDTSPLASLVYDNMDVDAVRSCGRLMSVGAVCLDTGEHRFARETNPDFVKWVLASSSFPVFFQPIEIEGKLWSDGGIKNVTPLGEAIRMGADEIDVIMCTSMEESTAWESTSKVALPDQLVRTIELMASQIVRNDIEVCGLKNALAAPEGDFRRVKVRVVAPESPLIKDSLSFDPEDIARMIEYGRWMADRHVLYDLTMPLQQLRNCNFGRRRSNATGSSGVGYEVFDYTGSSVVPRTTSGVYQTAPGIYAAYVTFPDNFRGSIVWDTGTAFATASYATEQYNVEENDPRIDSIHSASVYVSSSMPTVLSSLSYVSGVVGSLYDIQYGRWHIVGNQMVFYKDDNVTEVARFDLFDSVGSPTMDAVFERVKT